MSGKYTITVEESTDSLSFYINTAKHVESIFLNEKKVYELDNLENKTDALSNKEKLPYGHYNPPLELPCEVVFKSLQSLVAEPQISEDLRSSYESLLNDIHILGVSTDSLNLSKITMTPNYLRGSARRGKK